MVERGKRYWQKRAFIVLITFCLCWFAIGARLFWIQIVDTRSFSSHGVDLIEKSVSQRKQEYVLNSGRGPILDRNGVAMTGSTETTLVGFPLARHHLAENPKTAQLAHIINVSENELKQALEDLKSPGVLTFNNKRVTLNDRMAKEIEALQFPGVMALPYQRRYDEGIVAKHVLGFISKDPERILNEFEEELKQGTLNINSLIGASGIERSFQPFLQGAGQASISYFVDGKGFPLNGLTVRYQEPSNEFYPLSVQTTLDYTFQKNAEDIMDDVGIKDGAIVVLDAANADIIVMASRPNYNPENVNPSSDAWQNRALEQTIPGSIFKTIIAAAALNEGIATPDTHFECKGDYGSYRFICWKNGGHGHVSLAEGFAHSCNIVFGELAAQLGPDKIQSYAERLGVTYPVGWADTDLLGVKNMAQLDGEDPGVVFASYEEHVNHDKGNLLRTGIGQQDVQMTPLQAANLMVTLLNDGKVFRPRLVKELQFQTGAAFHTFQTQQIETEKIERYTAYLLKGMLEDVVNKGTASSLNDLAVAGKTGTGQLSNGNNNQWFIGYSTVDNPKYAIAVLAKNVPSTGKNYAIEAFRKTTIALAKK